MSEHHGWKRCDYSGALINTGNKNTRLRNQVQDLQAELAELKSQVESMLNQKTDKKGKEKKHD